MENIFTTFSNLLHQVAFLGMTPGNFIMILAALFFLYLAIGRGYEPLLLVPISFGMLLVNICPSIMEEGGLLHYFYLLDEWTILPSLIFLGVGAMTDFGPLIANPKSFLLGAAAQFGITLPLSVRCCWASMRLRRRLFPSSAVPMDQPPSIWP